MIRETVEVKARRLLVEGRVRVTLVDGQFVAAVVVGDTGEHEVVREGSVWSCSCLARRRCSHLEAVGLVVDPEPDPFRSVEEPDRGVVVV